MSTTTAILATGPSVVALAAIGSAVWQQRRGFTHDRMMRDLADTRALLDDEAVALHNASLALTPLERALFTHGSGMRGRAPESLTGGEQASEALRVVCGRLTIRLGGEHVVVRTLRVGLDATASAVRPSFTQDPSPSADVQEAFHALRDGHKTLITATDGFLKAATETVGAQLWLRRASSHHVARLTTHHADGCHRAVASVLPPES